MKKIILTLVLIVTTVTFAQKENNKEVKSPEQKSEKQLEKITKELDLNEKQQKEVKELLETQKENRKAIVEKRNEAKEGDEKPTKEERLSIKVEATKNKEAFKTKLKTILTEEQFKKWEAYVAEKKEEIKEKIKENKKTKKNSEK